MMHLAVKCQQWKDERNPAVGCQHCYRLTDSITARRQSAAHQDIFLQLDFSHLSIVDTLPPNASFVGYLNINDDGSVCYFQPCEQNEWQVLSTAPEPGHIATRKRIRHEPAWKRNKRKNARTHGLSARESSNRQRSPAAVGNCDVTVPGAEVPPVKKSRVGARCRTGNTVV